MQSEYNINSGIKSLLKLFKLKNFHLTSQIEITKKEEIFYRRFCLSLLVMRF